MTAQLTMSPQVFYNEYYTVVSGDSCATVEGPFEITFTQLHEWNPVIGSHCQYLDIGYTICVGVS